MRGAFNYDRDSASVESGLSCAPEEDMCQQQFADDCDINVIVKRFGLTGKVVVPPSMPMVGDFTEVKDFQSCMNLIRDAQQEFERMPADVRRRFANDPGALMAFLGDESNLEEAVKLGLVVAPPEKTRGGGDMPPDAKSE